MVCLLKVAFDGGVRGGAVLHSIAKGEAWKGLVVADLIAANQVDGTGLPAKAWWRRTRELMLGKSYALAAWGDRWAVVRHGLERTGRKKWCLG